MFRNSLWKTYSNREPRIVTEHPQLTRPSHNLSTESMKSDQKELSSIHELPWKRCYTFEHQMRYVSKIVTSDEARPDMMKPIVDTCSQRRAWQQTQRDTTLPDSLPLEITEEGKETDYFSTNVK